MALLFMVSIQFSLHPRGNTIITRGRVIRPTRMPWPTDYPPSSPTKNKPTPYTASHKTVQGVIASIERLIPVDFGPINGVRSDVGELYDRGQQRNNTASAFTPRVVDNVRVTGKYEIYSIDPLGRETCGAFGGADCINVIADLKSRKALYTDLMKEKSIGSFDRATDKAAIFSVEWGERQNTCGGSGVEREYAYEFDTGILHYRSRSLAHRCPIADCKCVSEDQYIYTDAYTYKNEAGIIVPETPQLQKIFN